MTYFLRTYACTVWPRITKFGIATERSAFLEGQRHPNGAERQRPKYLGRTSYARVRTHTELEFCNGDGAQKLG